jgi:hypothetical protein
VRRQLLLTAAGLVALALSIPLALLGRAVLATPAAVARTDVDWPGDAHVQHKRAPAMRVAESLLAADRAQRLFAVAHAYRHAAAEPAVAMASITPIRLAQMIRDLRSADERAQAHVMVGAIFALPAGNGTVSFDLVRELGGSRLLEQAAEEFRIAASIDERNEAAKYDLELLLKRGAISRASPRSSRNGKRGSKQQRNSQQTQRRRRGRSSRSTLEEHNGGIYANGTGY